MNFFVPMARLRSKAIQPHAIPNAGCSFVASLGADPIRDFEQDSAPFALARGKITGIVTSSAPLIKKDQASRRILPQALKRTSSMSVVTVPPGRHVAEHGIA